MCDSGMSVQVIRESLREQVKNERHSHRLAKWNTKRGILGKITATGDTTGPDEVSVLAEQLKYKEKVTPDMLQLLQEALIQSEENIRAFSLVNGALHALVGQLTGRDAAKQLLAAYCLCNLALGSPKVCLKVTKAAGVYLTEYLTGMNPLLMDACACVLGNLVASDPHSWQLVTKQRALPKLLGLLSSPHVSVARSALYAVTHYVRRGLQHLTSAEQADIARHVLPVLERDTHSFWLVFLLSCSESCDQVLLSGGVPVMAARQLREELSRGGSDVSVVTATVRVLGNLCGGNCGQGAEQVLQADPHLADTLQMLFASSHHHVIKEASWLVTNLLMHPAPHVQALPSMTQFRNIMEPAVLRLRGNIS